MPIKVGGPAVYRSFTHRILMETNFKLIITPQHPYLGAGGDEFMRICFLCSSEKDMGRLIHGLKMHTESPFNGLKMKSELLLAIRHNNDHMDVFYCCIAFIGKTRSFEFKRNPEPIIPASFIPGDYQSFITG